MAVLETEAGGEISRGGRSATDELVCGWHEAIGIVWQRLRAMRPTLQENRSMITKNFVTQKSQFRRLMYQATK